MEKLINHHVKYEELHGVDEIVQMTNSDHQKLHRRLRREGKCNVSVEELHKISEAAHHRSSEGRASKKKYQGSSKGKAAEKKYRCENIRRFNFTETLAPGIRLYEQIRYNEKTGRVNVNCRLWVKKTKKVR